MIRQFRRWMRIAAASSRQWPLIMLLAAGPFAACGKDTVSEEASQDLRDISRIEDLKAIFNQDAGVPRLILLLSPT